jgi:hypothetical protein
MISGLFTVDGLMEKSMSESKKHPWLKTIAQEVRRAKALKEKKAKPLSRQKPTNFPVDFSAR